MQYLKRKLILTLALSCLTIATVQADAPTENGNPVILASATTTEALTPSEQEPAPIQITSEPVAEEVSTTENGELKEGSEIVIPDIVAREDDAQTTEVKKEEEEGVTPEDTELVEETSPVEEPTQEVALAPEVEPEKEEPVIRVYHNKRVDAFIRMYTNRKRHVFEKGLERSAKYLPMIHRIFDEHGLPRELAYLAAVESNYNPIAVSRARAKGMWQFMYWTGKIYDLEYSWWHDERLSPEKSTVAAARYLKYLHNMFGDWELALAAYNSGSGTVRKAIRRNKKKGKPLDFWSLRLPRETRGYVPAFMAVTLIFRNLEEYGFTPVELQKEPAYKTLEIPGGIALSKVSKILDVDHEQLHKANPCLKYAITPATKDQFTIRVPEDIKTDENLMAKLEPLKKQTWKIHKVRRGDSLWRISRKYGVPMRQIVRFNQSLKKRKYLRVGAKIMLPIPSNWKTIRYAHKRSIPTRIKKGKYAYIHRVKRGDSLWKISQIYGVPIKSLVSWNDLGSRRRILKIGTKLIIPFKNATQTS